jgi:thymidylate synthase (FAD)
LSKVTLISYTQMNPDVVTVVGENPASPVEQNIAVGTNLSYSKKGIAEILERFEDEENIAGLFERSVGHGHMSILEHSTFSFLIEDISLPCGEQILRHRQGSFTKQSYRYQKATFEAVVPPKIKRDKTAHELYVNSIHNAYNTYKNLIDLGIPKEDARYIIPTGTKTRLMMSIDCRNLMHFIRERNCSHAQWEIRMVAFQMLKHLKSVAPNVAEYVTKRCGVDCTCSISKK